MSGIGTVASTPDIAVVTLGVESSAKTAQQAMAENSANTRAVIDRLKSLGIADRHLQTQALNLNPRYDHRRGNTGHNEPVLTGYQASNVITATLTDLTQTGEIIDAAIKAGSNRVNGIRFALADPTTALDQARAAAWQDAKRKAEQLAALAGRRLGSVVSISSHEQHRGPVQEVAMMRMADAVPIQAGEMELSIQLSVVWALE